MSSLVYVVVLCECLSGEYSLCNHDLLLLSATPFVCANAHVRLIINVKAFLLKRSERNPAIGGPPLSTTVWCNI